MKKLFYSLLAVVLAACGSEKQAPIDREALVARNNPQVSSFDSLASLSIGNGEFAFTVDATGLQTFPSVYKKGVPLVKDNEHFVNVLTMFKNPAAGYKHLGESDQKRTRFRSWT